MSRIAIFGAGGKAGRATVAEALRRGHEVTAVVRDPAKHADLKGVTLVAGDVTNPDVAGHDAVVSAVYDPAVPQVDCYAGAARAGAPRLIVVGLASVLETASGVPLLDTEGYPQEYRGFYLDHGAGVAALRTATTDWLVVSPAGDFDHAGVRTGRYRVVPADAASRVSYADLAVAVLDEIETPKHHRTHIGVESG